MTDNVSPGMRTVLRGRMRRTAQGCSDSNVLDAYAFLQEQGRWSEGELLMEYRLIRQRMSRLPMAVRRGVYTLAHGAFLFSVRKSSRYGNH